MGTAKRTALSPMASVISGIEEAFVYFGGVPTELLFDQMKANKAMDASTAHTSNMGFEEWGEIFGDEILAAALIRRLVHRGHIVNIPGNDYRILHHADLHHRATTRGLRPRLDPPHARRRR